MMWPFKRKPEPLNPGPINEDWKAGDLAECMVGGTWTRDDYTTNLNAPDKGDVLRVGRVFAYRSPRIGDSWYLEFPAIPGESFGAHAFRKVPELTTAADAEFTALIKSTRPVRA